MAGDLPPDKALELRSLVTSAGKLELSLHEVDVPPTPQDNEVLVRIEAAPINPSDLGLLVSSADMAKAEVTGTKDRPVVTAPIEATQALTARLDQSLPRRQRGGGGHRHRGRIIRRSPSPPR